MAHEVETMAYAGATPWHGLGKPVPGDLTPEQMLKAAGLDWGVEKRDMFLVNDDGKVGKKVSGFYALTRTTDDRTLSVVGKNFKPTQNEEILDFFKRFVDAGDMDLETAGSLRNGQFIWALARINASFTLGKSGDDVHSYLLLMQPHMYGYARIAKLTAVRVVCKNTLNCALGAGLTGKQTGGNVFRMSNTREFDEQAKEDARVALGLATKQAHEFEQAAKLLVRRKAKKEVIDQYFRNVISFDPAQAKTKADGTKREPAMLVKFREAHIHAPGQDMGTAKGTWWGAFNAVTHVIDHQVGRDRDTALTSAWLGTNSEIKRRALELALKEAA